MTSCKESPRSAEALDSPSTQRTASIILDFPHPLGPTIPTKPLVTGIIEGSTKDLKPASLILVSRNFDEYGYGYNMKIREFIA